MRRANHPKNTHIATVNPNTVSIVEPLEGTGKVDVHIIVMSIFGGVYPSQIFEQILMHVFVERGRSLNLIIHRSVEVERPADYFKDLITKYKHRSGCEQQPLQMWDVHFA